MGLAKRSHQRLQDFVDPLQTLLQNEEPEICNEREAAVAAIELLRIQDIEETVKFWTKDVLSCLGVRRKFLQPMKKALDIWVLDAIMESDNNTIEVPGIEIQKRKDKLYYKYITGKRLEGKEMNKVIKGLRRRRGK